MGRPSVIHLSHASPVHTEYIPSPLSRDSKQQNYRGFLNLAILLLFVNNFRLIFENYIKYGFLISVPGKYVPAEDWIFGAVIIAELFANLFSSYFIERQFVNKKLSNSSHSMLCFISTFTPLIFSTIIIWNYISHPTVGCVVLMLSITLFLKLASYHLVNADLLKGKIDEKMYEKCIYPKNITFKNILYFWFVPTLCYQPVYPQIPQFRKSFFAKRLFEFFSCTFMVYFLIEQYAIPTVRNSLKSMDEKNLGAILERLLKLSISSLYIWLLLFFAFFHSFLNALAEILKFADRSFYQDWWNARTIDEYWRLWNSPVHNWFKRHLYYPLRGLKVSPRISQFAIFLFSAIFHEYIIAVPIKMVRFWAFFGMLFQIPLIQITSMYIKYRPNSSFGNYLFWITFCIFGQPMCVLLYYRAWYNKDIGL